MASAPDRPADDTLCRRCGKCCYKKIAVGRGVVYITPFPCDFLDIHTNLCTIYPSRFDLNPLCLSVKDGMQVNAFPADCPYVPGYAPPGYQPARDEWDWGSEWSNFDDLADDLDVSEQTRAWVRARGPLAPPMYAEVNARRQRQAGSTAQPSGNSAGGKSLWNDAASRAGAACPSLAVLARGTSADERKQRGGQA